MMLLASNKSIKKFLLLKSQECWEKNKQIKLEFNKNNLKKLLNKCKILKNLKQESF